MAAFKNDSQSFLGNNFKIKPHLMSFLIELTSRCNENCIHCYMSDKKNSMEPKLFYSALEQCNNMGVLDLKISGGEPFLHSNFLEFLDGLCSYDFSVTILSNLSLLNDDILFKMKKINFLTVQVSLYSMNPEIHDSITQLHGSFIKTKNSIIKLIENDIPVQISCPVMKQNKNCYTDVLKWSNKHKCKSRADFIMMARSDHTKDNLNNRLSVEEVGCIVSDIINNDIDYQRSIAIPEFEKEICRDMSNDIICGVCISSLSMFANGKVAPCPGWQDYTVGNLYETNLREIWGHSPQVQYLRSLRKKDLPKCVQCEDRAFCAICMVRNANESPSGNPLEINEHFCKVAAINRKIVMDWKEQHQKGVTL
jgi:MoaA/NifB/PqqE/SkfB family radical SAM enzyme